MNKSRLLFRAGGAAAYLGGCHCLSGVWWFPSALIIRLSQPPAGDWLAGAWAELGNIKIIYGQYSNIFKIKGLFIGSVLDNINEQNLDNIFVTFG